MMDARKRPIGLLALACMGVLALGGCGESGGGTTEPEETIFTVTAFSENTSCSGGTCSQDIRGTARNSDGEFVSGATIFTYYTTSKNATRQAGPTAVTNGSGGYVLRFQFPVVTQIDYDIRVCAGTTIRQPDGRCAQRLVGFQ